MDFEESLPSHSTFVRAAERSGNFAPLDRLVDENSQYEERSASPPPPPPPPMSDDSVRGEIAERIPSKSSQPKPKFPFLRKNSRKEPSALNRMNSPSKSPISGDRSPNLSPASGDDNATKYQGTYTETHIAASAVTDNSRRLQIPLNTTAGRPTSGNKGAIDRFEESTVSIAGEHWRQQQHAAVSELEEFELIEQQLADSTNRTLTNSMSFSVQRASTVNNRLPDLNETQQSADSTGWEDAYDLERSMNYHGTSAASGMFDVKKRADHYGHEQMPENSEDQREDKYEHEYIYQPNAHNGEDNLDYSSKDDDQVGEYSEQQSTVNGTKEWDNYGRIKMQGAMRTQQGTHTQLPASIGRSISPNAGVHARINSNIGAASVTRPSESPSWGRATQPVQNSWDNEDELNRKDRNSTFEGEYSDHNLNRTDGDGESYGSSNGMKTARMSDSALRKITSRTAALQNNIHPTLERPSLADDISTMHPPVADDPPRGTVYTRPISSQRRLANTIGGTGTVKPRSSSTGGRLNRGGSATAQRAVDADTFLGEKAKELEDELKTYRSENATLKKLRKQQEQALAEVVHQKEEVMRWVAEEKQRTQKWCDEQQQLAVKERNAAAKMARDSRQKALSGTVPIRKEKAEIEALQATIEKMKIDHEQAAKKWKLNENRLYSLIKDHTTHIEETEKQLLALENEKIQLLEFIGENHLLLPKHLRSTLQRTPLYRPPNSPTSPSKTIMRGGSVSTIASSKSNAYTVAMDTLRGKSAASRDRNLHSNSGYAEEVDVDVVESSSSNYFAETQITALSTTDRLGPPKKSYEFKESTSSKTGVGKSSTVQVPGEVLNKKSSNSRSASAPRSNSNIHSNRGATSLSRSQVPSSAGPRESWASRSSRSSAGRYDECEASDRDDMNEQDSFRKSEVEALRSRKISGAQTGIGHGTHNVNTRVSVTSNLSQQANSSDLAMASTTPNSATAAGRVEEEIPGGGKIIRYKNGTVKEVDKVGNSVVRFVNGDTKSVNPSSGTVIYFYAEAKTTHTTFKDGLEVYEFPNKQVEMHFPDGIKEILFPDSTRKIIHPDGLQESHFPDGVILREHADGRREVLSNDQT